MTRLLPASSPQDLPPARTVPGFVAAGDRLVLFGGYGAAGPLGDMYAADPGTGVWDKLNSTGAVPSARLGCYLLLNTASLLNMGSTLRTYHSDLLLITYHKQSDMCPKFPLLLNVHYFSGRYGHGVACFQGSVYVFGGQTATGTFLL